MAIFQHRNFAILFAGQVISQAGNNLFDIALPWYVYTRTGSKAALASAGVAVTLPLLASLFAGVWVDRRPKRPTLVATGAARALICFLLFGAARAGLPVTWILVLVFLLQLAGAVSSPAYNALLPRLVPAEELPAATGLFRSGSGAAQLGGMLAGGALLDAVGAPLLFLLDGLSFVALVASLLVLSVSEAVPVARGTGGLWAEWVAGVRLAFRSRLVRRLLLAVTVANFALAPVDILLTAWVKGPLHGGGSLLGVINAGALAGVVVGGMMLGSLSRRAAVKTLLAAGLLCAGVGYAALGAWPDAVWDTSLAVLVGLGNGVTGGAATAWLLRAVPQGMLGRVTGLVNALSTVMTPLGVALLGGLMAYLPLNVLWWVLGAMMAVAGLSLVFPVEDDPDRVESGEAGVAGR